MLPTFIHVGPPRTGTTWLHEALIGHVGLPSEKETRFFDARYDRGLQWYSNLFGDYPTDVPAGEMAPTYFSNTIARERIKHDIPDCRIIVTLREPAARLYSLYKLIRSGSHPAEDTFDGYWRFQIDCGADPCNYAAQLKRWQATFGKSQVLVKFYEDLNANSQAYLDSICDFVGARRIALDQTAGAGAKVYSAPSAASSSAISRRSYEIVDWARRHGARQLIAIGRRSPLWKLMRGKFVEEFPPLSEESAEDIRAMMLPETEELERLTGRDLTNWKPRSRRTLDESRTSVQSQAG
jgi:sulfotransferase family protein